MPAVRVVLLLPDSHNPYMQLSAEAASRAAYGGVDLPHLDREIAFRELDVDRHGQLFRGARGGLRGELHVGVVRVRKQEHDAGCGHGSPSRGGLGVPGDGLRWLW